MKHLLTISLLTITCGLAWHVGSIVTEIDELHHKKIEIENIKLYTPETRPKKLSYQPEKELLNKQTKKQVNQQNDTKENENFGEAPYTAKPMINELELEEELQELSMDQDEVNVTLEDHRGYEGGLKQEVSQVSIAKLDNYKQRVLSRLFSTSETANEATTTETQEETYSEVTETLSQDTETLQDEIIEEQLPSETAIENPYENFNFSKQETLSLDLTTATTNGRILPNTRLTIENSQGKILLEGSTNIEGRFQKDLTVFTGETLYVRYYGVGISQEKNEITKQTAE